MLQSHLMFLSLLHGQYVEVLKNILKLLLTRTSKISIEFLRNTNVLLLQKSDDSPQNKEYQALLLELNGIKESSSYYMLLIQIATVMQKKYVNKAFEALFELFQSSYQSNDPETKAHYVINLMKIIASKLLESPWRLKIWWTSISSWQKTTGNHIWIMLSSTMSKYIEGWAPILVTNFGLELENQEMSQKKLRISVKFSEKCTLKWRSFSLTLREAVRFY